MQFEIKFYDKGVGTGRSTLRFLVRRAPVKDIQKWDEKTRSGAIDFLMECEKKFKEFRKEILSAISLPPLKQCTTNLSQHGSQC